VVEKTGDENLLDVTGKPAFQTLAVNIPGIVYRVYVRERNRMEFFNDMVEKMAGFKNNELKEGDVCSIDPIVIPDDRTHVIEVVNDALRENRPFEVEYRVTRKDGGIRYFLERGQPIYGSDGKPEFIDGIILDVTDRKCSEQALLFKENIIKSSSSVIATCDLEGYMTYGNPSFLKAWGFDDPKEFIGRPFWEFWIVKDRLDEIMQSLRDDGIWFGEIKARRKDGRIFDVQVLAAAVLDSEGKPIALTSTSIDITKRKIMEQTLVGQKALLSGIATILHEALTCQTEEELGEVCLRVAEEITESKFGFIGEIKGQHLEEIAISNPGWDACAELAPHGRGQPALKFELCGIYGRIVLDGKGFFTNEPTHHPDRIGLPAGHPPLESFLGIPLIHEGSTTGMIALANRPGGYTRLEQDSVEALAPVIVESFMRKRAEQALLKSEERFRAFVSASSEVVFRMNPNWTELRHLEGKEFIPDTDSPNRTWLDKYIYLDDQPHVLNVINEAIRTKSVFELEHRILRVDGTLGWAYSRAVPLLGANGDIVEWFGTASDITARKSTQDALRRSEERFRAIASNTPDHVLVQDRNLRYTMVVNPQLGLTEQDMIGKTDFDILVKEDAEKLTAIKHQVLETSKPVYMESPLISQDDKPEFFEGSYVPKFDAEGQCDGLIGYFRNVTQRKKAEEALRESEARLSAIVQSAEEAIITLDKELRVLRANPAAGVITGVPHDQLIGQSLSEFVDPSFNLSSAWEEFVKSGRFKGEFPIRHSSGSVRVVEASGTADIGPGRHLFVGHDITERKRMEEELRRSRDELEQRVRDRTAELELRNKELQDFAFVASHDLSEPLRKIETFGRMLVDRCGGGSFDEVSKDYLKRMQKATTRMQNLLNSLLLYSRVTTKAAPLKKTDLNRSVHGALSNLEMVMGEKNAEVEIGDLPTIEADRVQMIQLFQNLIGNALKFGRDGVTPHIKIYGREDWHTEGAYEICVEDNGIGFDEKYLDKIFQPFQRLHGRSCEYEGEGMGLAICRKILERNGGKITAKSELGKGSTFIVTLPRNRKAE
jgi:PAS domain S-box-containing protein